MSGSLSLLALLAATATLAACGGSDDPKPPPAPSLLLGALGGLTGAALGAAVTVIYAGVEDQPAVVPALALVGGLGAAVIIGAIAGLYPSLRAARLSPTEALRTV